MLKDSDGLKRIEDENDEHKGADSKVTEGYLYTFSVLSQDGMYLCTQEADIMRRLSRNFRKAGVLT